MCCSFEYIAQPLALALVAVFAVVPHISLALALVAVFAVVPHITVSCSSFRRGAGFDILAAVKICFP